MADSINNSEDLIDVRNIIERFEELEDEQNDLAEAAQAEDATADDRAALAEWKEDNGDELAELEDLLGELAGNGGDEKWRGDWYPVSLIRESYFETAMDELLEDIGDIPKNLPSYLRIKIDYDALQMDYTSVEIGNITYWYR